MRIFSLDTSFSFLNFSVVEDGKVIFTCYMDHQKKALENLPKVFADYRIRPEDYDAYAVSVGVGYLTSVRIGVTFMKSWAYLFGKPLVGYENLEMMLLYTPAQTPKVSCLRVSNTVFCRVMEENRLSQIKVFKDIIPSGSIISLREHNIEGSHVVLECVPFSAFGGLYAYKRLISGYAGDDVFLLEPFYLKS